MRHPALDCRSDTGEEAPTSGGDDDGVDVREVIEDLEADGALARHDMRMVKRMNEGLALSFSDGLHTLHHATSVDKHRSAPKSFNGCDLCRHRRSGHHHHR